MTKPDLEAVFQRLRAVLEPYEPGLVKVQDAPDNYYLDSTHTQTSGKPLFFGSVRIGKQFVSYHLMPVYLWPDMLEGMSAALRRRMQGKSCFNFKALEPQTLEELAALTRQGFEKYRETGYVD